MNITLNILSVLLAIATLLLANPVVEKRQGGFAARFIVRNACPAPINVYVGLNLTQMLTTGGNATIIGQSGLFFTDANEGMANGSRTTRGGFFDVRFRNHSLERALLTSRF